MQKICSCIVPCFNEEEVIPIYYKEMKKVMEQDESGVDYEIIFIDDGSSDGTLDEVRKLMEIDQRVSVVSFTRNFGKEAALYVGLEHVGDDYVVTMDVDL